jgi:heat shock protein HslJ
MPDLRLPARAALSGLAALICALIQGCAMLLDLAPIPLPDGKWELVTATFAETGRVPGAPRATLAFQDGRISAFSGCNSATGAVRGVESRLEVQQLAVTRRGCPEPLAWFEARFFKMLRAGPSYHVDGAVLALSAGNDRARFRRATEP